jgi:hypothetical protein
MRWLERSVNCPYCRTIVVPEPLVLIGWSQHVIDIQTRQGDFAERGVLTRSQLAVVYERLANFANRAVQEEEEPARVQAQRGGRGNLRGRGGHNNGAGHNNPRPGLLNNANANPPQGVRQPIGNNGPQIQRQNERGDALLELNVADQGGMGGKATKKQLLKVIEMQCTSSVLPRQVLCTA